MADNLKRLAESDSVQGLQEKLNCWLRDYNSNSCDDNLNSCLEIIEQVAKVQGQLFGILTVTAQEGGNNEGVEVIKSRLLPWLEASFNAASSGKPIDSKAPSLQDTFDRERSPDRDQQQFHGDLNQNHSQHNQVQEELKSLQAQDDARHRNSESKSTDVSKSEPRGSSKWSSEHRTPDPRTPGQWSTDVGKHVWNLKDEMAALSSEKSALQGSRSARSRSPSPCHSRSRSRSRSHSRNRSGSNSPSTAIPKIRSPSPNRSKLSSVARRAALLSRFSDAYSQARLDAQCLLRRCIDRAETVQRIIYIATVESFHVAKMAFRHFRIRVQKMLTPSHLGTNDFENAVSDYIVCHLHLYDSQSSVNDVIRVMNINPKISFPPEVDFCLLNDFIQEICRIAFAMQALDPPLDIAFGADGEVFNDRKYRRSYDSDFTAPLVFYHVWPALMENECVIMKGEAVTKRGAFWNSMRPLTRCRSRSLSPISPRRGLGSSTLCRSRSPSPIRCTLPRY